MAKLNTVVPSATHSVLIYGDAKTGKTSLAGSLSKEFNLIWVDCENGFGTLFKLPPEQQERIELIHIPDTKESPKAYETLLKLVTGRKLSICEAHGQANCPICTKNGSPSTTVELNAVAADTIVVFDSLTQLANSIMAHITRDKTDDYKPTWDDFANQNNILVRFLSSIQAANYNVICITHVVESEMEDGKKKLSPMCGTRNMSATVAKYFDHVIFTQVRNLKHEMGSSSTYASNVQTGSRTDVDLSKGDTLIDLFSNRIKAKTDTATGTASATKAVGNASIAAAKLAEIKAKVIAK